MLDRSIYDQIIINIREISTHHSQEDFEQNLKNIIDIRDNFNIKLMVVGHFSAGKSSLLNGLLEKTNFLKEAQEPTTAIATELIYDENESAFAYDLNGKREVICIDKKYLPDKYNHLEYKLDIASLKKVSDFTIVDTPGLDSGIEAHSKALNNYIGFGSAYLLVIDQEKGGISQTELQFIQEISNYSKHIAVLINKCDKISIDVSESIVNSARQTLEINDFPYKVYTISKKDKNISEKLISIISDFDVQVIFRDILSKQIKAELINIEKVLSVTKNKIYLDTFDLDSDIALYNRLEKRLYSTFDMKKKEAKEELDNIVQDVMCKLKNTLLSSTEYISDALRSENQIAIETIIIEIIRPVMLSTMKNISSKEVDNITNAIDFTGLVKKSEEVALSDIRNNIASNLKDIFEQGIFNKKLVRESEESYKNNNIYRTVMGIGAIATDIVAPWIEVAIILLPDILTLFQSIFGESEAEVVERRFRNVIVPQILNKIYPQVKQNVELTINVVLEEYEKILNDKLITIKNNIIKACNNKQQKIEEFERYKMIISDDIRNVERMLIELE